MIYRKHNNNPEFDTEKAKKIIIQVGAATCGISAGALETKKVLEKEISESGKECIIMETGCIGMCYAEPIISIIKPGKANLYFKNVNTKKAKEILEKYIIKNIIPKEYVLGKLGNTFNDIPDLYSTPVLKYQQKRILNNCGIIDPENTEHYIKNKGYEGIKKVLSIKNKKEILDELENSGLRGRGGAGFPTYKKWKFAADVKSKKKYIVCNADEGDPGAFMNRSLLEGDPHSLLEGMLIAGYTIGADEGYIYCRAEYPLALKRLSKAIKQAEEANFLGTNILGSKFSFKIKIKEGAGAFVCGEETALIASIEGKRGMPVTRPPFPAVSGLWGKPTIINNVETLVAVSRIFQNCADWFAEFGTEKSKGTKTFALAGKIEKTGLIEVPLGTTIKKIIEIGGNNKNIKAVQTGGPSGGCIPKKLFNTPVDYEELGKIGSIMGSGGIVVMDKETCMVDVARYFLDFASKESCGKCVPCRLGTKEMLEILEKITKGKGKTEDLELLKEMGESVKKSSLCGLGQTAPNPVLTTIKYFEKEYIDHIKNKKCNSGVCKELIHYKINPDKCKACHICSKVCPSDAIKGEPKEIHEIVQDKCIKCGMCYENCPDKFDAVEKIPGDYK